MTKTRIRSRLATLGIGIVALALSIAPGIASARQHIGLASPVAAPVFSFPTNGTSYPSNGPYLFQVQAVSGATGYLWSFVQNGTIVYQNLAWDGHLSPASYTVATRSKAHSLIHSGDLHVWVRALMKNGQWSATGSVLVRIQGRGGPHSKPTPVPQATATPAPPAPGTILYQANWANGPDGWTLPQGWDTVSGELVNDGTSTDTSKHAQPPVIHPYTANYAVEAEIQMVRTVNGPCGGTNGAGFGITVREDSNGYYVVGMADIGNTGWHGLIMAGTEGQGWYDCTTYYHPLAGNGVSLDTNWHTYRVEVRGNDIKLLMDGNSVAETTDNQHLRSNVVGLSSAAVVINVRSFKVIAL